MLQSIQGFQWTKTTKVGITSSSQATQVQQGNTTDAGIGIGGIGGTRSLELASDTDCFVSVGPHGSTTATLTTSLYLPAKVPVIHACNPGDDVAVIGTAGNIYISEGR